MGQALKLGMVRVAQKAGKATLHACLFTKACYQLLGSCERSRLLCLFLGQESVWYDVDSLVTLCVGSY